MHTARAWEKNIYISWILVEPPTNRNRPIFHVVRYLTLSLPIFTLWRVSFYGGQITYLAISPLLMHLETSFRVLIPCYNNLPIHWWHFNYCNYSGHLVIQDGRHKISNFSQYLCPFWIQGLHSEGQPYISTLNLTICNTLKPLIMYTILSCNIDHIGGPQYIWF